MRRVPAWFVLLPAMVTIDVSRKAGGLWQMAEYAVPTARQGNSRMTERTD